MTGTYLRHVRRFLNGELGAHVEAMFWEHVPHRLEHGTAPPPDRRRQTAAHLTAPRPRRDPQLRLAAAKAALHS